MPITAKFVVRVNENSGVLGLKMIGRDWAEPLVGMAAIHDMLEHFPGDNGTTEEELMALGASLFVRKDYHRRMGHFDSDPANHIASEMPSLCHYRQQDGADPELRNPGRTYPIPDSDVEESIQRIAQRTRYLLPREFEGEYRMYRWAMDARLIGWLRRGYRRAQHRYRISPHMLMESFIQAEQDADLFLRDACEGDRCTIKIWPQRAVAEIIDDSPRD